MNLRPVSREDIPQSNTREGKVSTGIFREFLASGEEVVQVELEEDGKSIGSVRSTLSNYVKRHNLPVRVFTAGGNLYIERAEADAELAAATA